MAKPVRKIVVRNVGVLKAFDTPSAPKLAPLTLFYARNGRGKSTLSAVMHSAATGDPAALKGRKTFGSNGGEPEVSLVFDSGLIRYSDDRWSQKGTPIEVFDSTFIAKNLYAGEATDLEHDRGLFTIILGQGGVKLSKQQEFFNGAAKHATQNLKDAEAALKDDIPSDMTREEFFAYAPSAAIEDQIKQAERELKSIQHAERLTKLSKVEKLAVPSTALELDDILQRTVASIEATARDQLAAHFGKFKLGKQGEAWVKFGLEHIHDDSCPFCGKDNVDDLGLTTLYGQIFGDAYKAHFDAIKQSSDDIDTAFGHGSRADISKRASANVEAVRGWSEFLNVEAIEVPPLDAALEKLEQGHAVLKKLFDAKRQAPLAAIEGGADLASARDLISGATKLINQYNEAIEKITAIIDGRRSGSQTEAQASQRVTNLSKRRRRQDAGVQTRIDAALRAKRADTRAKAVRTIVQTRLKAANDAAASHYYAKVNDYLRKFGATFQISEITNSMSGNIGSVNYGLVVRGHPVARGRGRANDEQPSFMNTLSTGDKTTLAFSFFLAGLDRHSDLSDRIIVFDDPLSSHDTHRQAKTVELLHEVGKKSAQIIVLSHDAHFLRLVSRRSATVEQASYEIEFDGADNWSKAKVANLDELCQSDHARQLKQLKAYYENRKGTPSDVAPSVRRVLETHYRRSFSAYFKPDENLGGIISAVRDHGPTHPCWNDLATLEGCNSATTGEHHGDHPEVVSSAPIDPDALHVIVGECLVLVRAIRPAPPAALKSA